MPHNYHGTFVTFEGLDYSGKTTQAIKLIDYLNNHESVKDKRRVLHLREPGGTVIGDKVREILLDKYRLEMTNQTELLLFSAARAQIVAELITPSLKVGDVVVLDRFYDLTTAYQGYGRGIDMNIINTITNFAVNGVEPDLTFIVDISIEEMKRRQRASGLNIDRMESSGIEFFKRVQEGYVNLRKEFPERMVGVDGKKDRGEIHKKIMIYVDKLLKQKYL